MKRFNFELTVFIFLLWACNSKSDETVLLNNDTTIVLNQALMDAVSVKYMPDAGGARRPYIFEDSILLTSKVTSLDLLPTSVGEYKFKVMNEADILQMLRYDSNKLFLPNYLILSRIESNDSGYYIQIQNLSAVPFGGGGSLGIYYKRKGDSLINVQRLASSIN